MLPIVWAERAKRNYAEIIESLSETSINAALKLDEKTDKAMLQISKFPYSCQASSSQPRYRRCVISKNHSVVYEVREKFIYVISFVDNRRK